MSFFLLQYEIDLVIVIYLHMVNSLGIWYICVHIPNDLWHPRLFVTVCRPLSVSVQ